MAKPMHVKFEVPKELSEKALEALEKVRVTGKLRRGANEVTKIIERGQAVFVVLAEDVSPPEIVAHIPILCDEKNVPYAYVPNKAELGVASGVEVPTSAVCVIKAGDAKPLLDDLTKKVKDLRK